MPDEEKKIIIDLIDLIQSWQRGIFKTMGVNWLSDPPALLRAIKYIQDQSV